MKLTLRLSCRMIVAALFLALAGVGSGRAAQPPAGAAPETTDTSDGKLKITVTADHPDWNYRAGEPVRFRVVAAEGASAAGAEVTYSVGPEKMAADTKTAVLGADGAVELAGGTMDVPGFLRCTVTVKHAGHTARGTATAALSADKIEPTQTEPKDFDAFWATAKAQLAALPIDPQLTPLPELSTADYEVFQVSLQNIATAPAKTSRFYGILCVPRGEGPFPAMMIPPGAGIRRLTGETQWAKRGFITLQVGIHGIPVTLPPELYVSLGGALGDYPTIHLDEKDRYYFRRVFMGCLRANDYLTTHPKWDHKNLIAHGGSQGGFLTIVTTALDPRVTACVVAFPAYCDVTGYARGRAGGWPGLKFEDENAAVRDVKIATTGYYDAVNFARRIKVAGHYGWGYNDETCPPTSMFAAYNQITASKVLDIFKEMGHPRVPELTVKERDWVLNVGLKK